MVLRLKIMSMSKVIMMRIMSTEMMVSIIVFVVVFVYQLKGMQNCASGYLEIIWIIKKRSIPDICHFSYTGKIFGE